MNITTEKSLQNILNHSAIIDIETSSFTPDGKEININSDFQNYLKYAIIKWIGIFSYKYNKIFIFKFPFNSTTAFEEHTLPALLSEHNILIGHNLIEFDFAILLNNKIISETEKFLLTDTLQILGKSSFINKDGMRYKGRAELMEVDLESNSLKSMGKSFNLDIQKGDIDYRIFQKDVWSHEETQEIVKYLTGDILTTKGLFDKLWTFWKPFTEFLPQNSINDLSWIRSSIASVIYKSCCNILGEIPTYSDKHEKVAEAKGGNVFLPSVEEETDVFICDFSSLYPHIFAMFNLFSEMSSKFNGKYVWKGNDVFKVRGTYDCSRPSVLSKLVIDFLKKRMELKKTNPSDPLIYTYKIFLNGLYGIVRSPLFEKVYKPNAGWDCCDLGQQCQKILNDILEENGFKRIFGDTDSLAVKNIDSTKNNKEFLRQCLDKVVQKIKSNAPFQVDTFDIAIEKKVDYIMFPFSDEPVVGEDGKNIKIKNRLVKERKAKKKNYLYLYENKGVKEIEIKGLPIIKDNSTKLGYEIYEKVLKPIIIKRNRAKFTKEEIDKIVNNYLTQPDLLFMISVEYKVKPVATYKNSCIQGQISKEYFGKGEGVIRLIKNTKVGKVGKGKTFYCTVEEAQEAKLKPEDLDLVKLWKELQPFILETVNEKDM